jgi:hypothetical protein
MRSPADDQNVAATAGCVSGGTWHRRLRISTDFALLRLCEASHKRKAWLFAGSELAGQRAAMVMSLAQSAKLNGHDPWAYLKDVLERLQTHPNHRIDELLPHRWQPTGAAP